ncbi:MAG TPA: hypothetical protein VIM71_13975 [Lacunisphaera sp.]
MPRPFPTSRPRGGTSAALSRMMLALLHLSMVATAQAAQQVLALPKPISRPYLATFGAPALRFQEAPPPPPAVKPIASGPPVAASAPEVAEVSLANNQAAASTPPMPVDKPVIPPAAMEQSPAATDTSASPARPPAKALPILPDDTRTKVQSQDFLPLFRFPGGSSSTEDVDVIVPGVPRPPAPNSLPPSSATYRQY